MPINYNEYPPEFPAISQRIRTERAKNKCEWCGAKNHQIGYWMEDGFHLLTCALRDAGITVGDIVSCINGKKIKIIRIVLTVAHLNHDKQDCRDENLAALCQRCHLAYDLPHHIASRKYGRNHKGKQQLTLEV